MEADGYGESPAAAMVGPPRQRIATGAEIRQMPPRRARVDPTKSMCASDDEKLYVGGRSTIRSRAEPDRLRAWNGHRLILSVLFAVGGAACAAARWFQKKHKRSARGSGARRMEIVCGSRSSTATIRPVWAAPTSGGPRRAPGRLGHLPQAALRKDHRGALYLTVEARFCANPAQSDIEPGDRRVHAGPVRSWPRFGSGPRIRERRQR